MKRITITICSAVMLFACEESKKPEPASEPKVASASETNKDPMPDSATIRKNWEAYMTPGKEHEMMAQSNGAWAADITMWMDPSAPPKKSTGTTTNTMVLGGRYQQGTHKGTYDGMPMEGISTLAFDNAKKVYVSTWIDNMGTGMMVGEGPWDEASKSVTIKGKMVNPATGKEEDFKEVFSIVDNDHQVMKMYCNGPDGKEFQTMEIKYSRKK